jgi:putative transcriptional regulator
MAQNRKAKGKLTGKARMCAEIVEAMAGLHKIGAVSAAELEKTTLRMLGRDALPKVANLSPAEIAKVREERVSAKRCWRASSTSR